jgi:hypothetical protein
MTDGRDQGGVRRPVVVTAILLVGVAVLLVALRSWLLGQPDAVDGDANLAAESAPIEVAPEEPPDEPTVEPTVAETPAVVTIGVPVPAAPPPPTKVVLLPARAETSDPAALLAADTVRQATLRALRAMPSMEVVDVGASELAAVVPAHAGSLGEDNLAYLAVAEQYDTRLVAEIAERRTTSDSPYWNIFLHVRRATGSSGRGTAIGKNGDTRLLGGQDAESVGVDFAQRIAQRGGDFSISSPASGDARDILLDGGRSEDERLRALNRLLNEGLDSETMAAAVGLATSSLSASTRQRVWAMLRQTAHDPALAQHMNLALLSDTDAGVRKEAALALAAYLDNGAIRASLEHAAASDGSADVRLAARMATMSFDEQQAFKRETLLDRSLTAAERLAPTTMLARGSMVMLPDSFGADEAAAAAAYAEIADATDDPLLKLNSLSELQRTIMIPGPGGIRGEGVDDEIIRVLIESSKFEDARVRRLALNLLTRQSGHPDARATLEAVLAEQPELAAELRIAEALERGATRGVP